MPRSPRPTRATCGSCHDDVNFATGQGHAAGPQPNDNSCARCHIPEGELEFDASVKGAHTIPRFSRDLPGVNFEILGVTNTKPGERPAVTLKITDKQGFPIETSQMNSLSLLISGPNTDFASYWRESALNTPSQNGMLTYTFQQAIPTNATGSYSVAVEGYRLITLQPGTTSEVEVRDAGFNKILPFAVTDSTPVARRSVITTGNCNSCHGTLAEHGSQRLNVEYCQFCHNANATDAEDRPAEVGDAADGVGGERHEVLGVEEAEVALLDAEDLEPAVERGQGHRAQDGVEAGRVATTSVDRNP